MRKLLQNIVLILSLVCLLNSCGLQQYKLFKIPKGVDFAYDTLPNPPYPDYKIAVDDKITWNGKEIIPLSYMQEFVSNPRMTTPEGVPNYRYGLHVWTYLGGKDPVYYCRGILGQFIIAIPAKQLIIVRTGSIRGKNINLPDEYEHNKAYIEKYKYKFGHPADLFQYIAIAERMIK